ncbi:serine/threonine-protein phosphatase 2A activator [Nematocida homosporus]|uniref:serine/threonine-protein phosphatase 2A activator n=1 Tax=Nematocida homosporus TaxID=1912981 RepID=UPI002220597C|nr:serine/threonine-protein phosphatase 2A activator [Nematocida homosporus]KAI5185980.1 serine/threonine-protein phosphatase 2A activator [Nematocida homosporus]
MVKTGILAGCGQPEKEEVVAFKRSTACAKITKYLSMLDKLIQEKEIEGDIDRIYDLDSTPDLMNASLAHQLLIKINDLINDIPVEEDANQRYGNKGFVTFLDRLQEISVALIKNTFFSEKAAGEAEILSTYLNASFGNRTRIDYGTGHELNFFCFLIILHELDKIATEELLVVLEHYFSMVRLLILKYKLEAAGSYGTWGIDDYQLLPFVLGSSQFCRHIDMAFGSLFSLRSRWLCFAKALRFSQVHKTYSSLKYSLAERVTACCTAEIEEQDFAKHSPMLYALRDVTFTKINKGMYKMYDNVVLNQYVVIQHFISSEYLPV